MKRYRMIGYSGVYDKQSDSRDNLIREISARHGLFTLWTWTGRIWTKEGTFLL